MGSLMMRESSAEMGLAMLAIFGDQTAHTVSLAGWANPS